MAALTNIRSQFPNEGACDLLRLFDELIQA